MTKGLEGGIQRGRTVRKKGEWRFESEEKVTWEREKERRAQLTYIAKRERALLHWNWHSNTHSLKSCHLNRAEFAACTCLCVCVCVCVNVCVCVSEWVNVSGYQMTCNPSRLSSMCFSLTHTHPHTHSQTQWSASPSLCVCVCESVTWIIHSRTILLSFYGQNRECVCGLCHPFIPFTHAHTQVHIVDLFFFLSHDKCEILTVMFKTLQGDLTDLSCINYVYKKTTCYSNTHQNHIHSNCFV